MQIKDSNFFNTQLPSSQRCSQQNEESTKATEPKKQKKNPSMRIHIAKSQAKKAANFYNETLQQLLRTKKSLQKSKNHIHKLQSQFFKLYTTKKLKYINKSLTQQSQTLETQAKIQLYNRVRTNKLKNEFGLLYSKHQHEENSRRLIQNNKKYNENFKKYKVMKKMQLLNEAQSKYQAIKRNHEDFVIRKKNMETIASTRAHHNYLVKINQQVESLEKYTQLLEKVNQIRDLETINEKEADCFNNTFFITTKNTIGG